MGLWPTVDDPRLRHPSREDRQLVTLQTPRAPSHTLVCPFSRPWAFDRWLERFRSVELPGRTEVIAVVDHDSEAFYRQVRAGLLSLFGDGDGLRIAWTRQAPAPEWEDIHARRTRICSHWHLFLESALGRIILGAEDDTLPAPDAYIKLCKHLNSGAAFAQGTILGRWDAGFVPHFSVLEEDGAPVEWKSAFYDGQDVVPIRGGGWYCFAAERKHLLRVTFRPRPGAIGPDIWAVYELSQRGLRCVGDWTVHCEHVCESMTLSPNRSVIDVVTYRHDGARWRPSISGGRGCIIDHENIQVGGSQPRRPRSTRATRVKTLKLFGSKPPERREWVESN